MITSIPLNTDMHSLLDMISAAAMLGWFIVGLMIKASLSNIRINQMQDKAELIHNQETIKSDLIKYQTGIKEDLMRDGNKTDMTLAVHMATDEEKFNGITGALTRIDHKLDMLNSKS